VRLSLEPNTSHRKPNVVQSIISEPVKMSAPKTLDDPQDHAVSPSPQKKTKKSKQPLFGPPKPSSTIAEEHPPHLSRKMEMNSNWTPATFSTTSQPANRPGTLTGIGMYSTKACARSEQSRPDRHSRYMVCYSASKTTPNHLPEDCMK